MKAESWCKCKHCQPTGLVIECTVSNKHPGVYLIGEKFVGEKFRHLAKISSVFLDENFKCNSFCHFFAVKRKLKRLF